MMIALTLEESMNIYGGWISDPRFMFFYGIFAMKYSIDTIFNS